MRCSTAAAGMLLTLAPVPASAGTTANSVIAFERARRAAVASRDVKAIGAMSAPDLRYVDASGFERDRTAHLEHIATEGLAYRSWSYDVLSAKPLGNLAVLTGVFRFAVDVKGRSNSGVQHFTAIYRRAGRSWQLVIWHPTRATDRA